LKHLVPQKDSLSTIKVPTTKAEASLKASIDASKINMFWGILLCIIHRFIASAQTILLREGLNLGCSVSTSNSELE